MATYDDYDGVYFTIQSLREHHLKNIEKDIEFIVLDNNPTSKHGDSVKKFTQNFVKGKYIPYTEKSSSFNKYKIVDFANGKYVIIVDCHVLFSSNAITSLLKYFEENPNCKDLIQGPLVNDNLIHESTHLNEEWRNDMYGFWACDHEKLKTKKPFEIKMQGMGCCAFEKSNWPKINKNFDHLIMKIAEYHITHLYCFWCIDFENVEDLIIEHLHIKGNAGKYRGCLCKRCNRLEAEIKKMNRNQKIKYLYEKINDKLLCNEEIDKIKWCTKCIDDYYYY